MPYIFYLAAACAGLGLLILGFCAVRRHATRATVARDMVGTVDGVPVTTVEYQAILATMLPSDRQLMAAAEGGKVTAVDAIQAGIIFVLAVRAYREQ